MLRLNIVIVIFIYLEYELISIYSEILDIIVYIILE